MFWSRHRHDSWVARSGQDRNTPSVTRCFSQCAGQAHRHQLAAPGSPTSWHRTFRLGESAGRGSVARLRPSPCDRRREFIAHPRGTGRHVRLFRQVRRHDSTRPKRPAISALFAHLEPDLGIELSACCIACLHAFGSVALPSRSERSPLYHSQFSNDRTQTPYSPQPYQCRAVPRFRWGRQSVSRCTVGARAEGCRATAARGRRTRRGPATASRSAPSSPSGRRRS